ncbi:MAG: rod shape-determining protein MreD [Pseudomonadota bacterium]
MLMTALQKIDRWTRYCLPAVVALGFLLLAMVPIRLTALAPISPWILLIVVYFWTAHRPDLLPVWAVFVLGLLSDLLSGGPVGPGTFTLLLVAAAVRSQRRHILPHSFIVQWVVFALLAVLAEALLFLSYVVAYRSLLPVEPAAFQALMTIAIYPCVAWIFVQIQYAFLRQI